jgi:hypothetical protein
MRAPGWADSGNDKPVRGVWRDGSKLVQQAHTAVRLCNICPLSMPTAIQARFNHKGM